MDWKFQKIIASFFAMISTTMNMAYAHDFWMQPNTFAPHQDAADINIKLQVGHAGEQNLWKANPDRIITLQVISDGKTANILKPARTHLNNRQAQFSLAELPAGTHILTLETDNAFIELESDKFKNYIDEEGLTAIIADYEKDPDRPGSELYARNAKTIVQIGDVQTDVSTPLGQSLELVPLKHPHALEQDEPLQIAVYYQGERASGVSVHLESLTNTIVPERTKLTDKKGIVAFDLPKTGAWKIDTVWGEPISNDLRANYQTIFSSLTFGFE